MPKLNIHLNEGFKNEAVEVRLNGLPVARLAGVSTNYSTGLAGTAELEAPSGSCQVDVEVPGTPPARTELTIKVDTFLSVRKEEGRLVLKSSTTPPVYL